MIWYGVHNRVGFCRGHQEDTKCFTRCNKTTSFSNRKEKGQDLVINHKNIKKRSLTDVKKNLHLL